MKKKGINILAITAIGVLAIVLIAVLCLVPSCNNGGQENTNIQSISLLDEYLFAVDSYEELQALAEEYALEVEFDSDSMEYNIYRLECFNNKGQMSFRFNEEDTLAFLTCYITIFGYKDPMLDNPQVEEYSVNDLIDSNAAIFACFQNFLGISDPDNFYILGKDEILDNQSALYYQAIIDGDAYFEFTAEDSDGSLWIMQTTTTEDGVAYCMIEHYVDRDIFDGLIPNIYIE